MLYYDRKEEQKSSWKAPFLQLKSNFSIPHDLTNPHAWWLLTSQLQKRSCSLIWVNHSSSKAAWTCSYSLPMSIHWCVEAKSASPISVKIVFFIHSCSETFLSLLILFCFSAPFKGRHVLCCLSDQYFFTNHFPPLQIILRDVHSYYSFLRRYIFHSNICAEKTVDIAFSSLLIGTNDNTVSGNTYNPAS